MGSYVIRRDMDEVLEIMALTSDEEYDDSDEDNDLELLLLFTCTPKRDLGFHINLAHIGEDECENMFRFQKHDITRLKAALNLPPSYQCRQRTVCSSEEALLILLRRLAYPNRWCDLVGLFGRAEPELSMIFTEVKLN